MAARENLLQGVSRHTLEQKRSISEREFPTWWYSNYDKDPMIVEVSVLPGLPWTFMGCPADKFCPGCRKRDAHTDAVVVAIDGRVEEMEQRPHKWRQQSTFTARMMPRKHNGMADFIANAAFDGFTAEEAMGALRKRWESEDDVKRIKWTIESRCNQHSDIQRE